MKLVKLKVVAKALILSSLTAGLIACGGGGGSTPAAAVTTTAPPAGTGNANPSAALTTQFTPADGKLIPQVRPNGYTAKYTTNADYRKFVDVITAQSAIALGNVGGLVKWPFDIPAIFSGCGYLNALFGSQFDMHAHIRTKSAIDPTVTFGANNVGDALIMCHELTEANVTYFLDPASIAKIHTNFSSTFADPGMPTVDELAAALSLSVLLFEWQVMFHELGHGLDQMLLKDGDNAIKKQFMIPKLNTCNSPTIPCDTIGEDFADWISSLIMVELIKIELAATPAQSVGYFAALFTALDAWEGVLGAGGGAVHSKTDSRQANMACYAYGGIPELRTAEANSGGVLTNYLAARNVNIITCEASYAFNVNLTETLLAPFVKM